MPWTPPNDPVTSTVITVAYAVANLLTQIRWLRLMTGNADPPGTAYVLTSDSVSAVTWKLHAAAILADLGYTPLNRAGDTMTGPLVVPAAITVTRIDDAGSGGRLSLGPSAGQLGAIVDVSNNQFRVFNPTDPTKIIVLTLASGAVSLPGSLTLAALSAITTGRIIGTAPSSGAGYTIDAESNVLRIYNTANPAFILTFGLATNVLAVGGQTVITSATIGAQSVAFATTATTATTATNASTATTALSATTATTATNANQLGGRVPGGNPGQVPYNAGAAVLNQGLNAEFLGGADRAYYESLSGGGGGTGTPIPPGLICLWNAATPPIGWAIETTFRERFPLSASAPGGTWPLGTNAGTATHTHATNITHGHADTISVGGNVGAATGVTPEVNVVTPGTKTAADTHAHGFTGTKGGGVTALGSSPVTSDATAHMPAFYALHYIRKS